MANKWDKRFMRQALTIAPWSSCNRRQVGAIIVRDNHMISTGYNGAPSGVESCADKKHCLRELSGSGQDLHNCMAVHAEENAILQAARFGIATEGATLYCTSKPCDRCIKAIIQAGIKRVVYYEEYPTEWTELLAAVAGIELVRYVE